MKKPVITALFTFTVIANLAVNAQNAPVKVPMLATKALQSKFPKATPPIWQKTANNNYVAEFKVSGDKTIAVFDDHGTFLETQMPMKLKKMPEAVKNGVEAQYKDPNINNSAIIETATKETFYKVVVEKGAELIELRLNKDGAIVNTMKKNKS